MDGKKKIAIIGGGYMAIEHIKAFKDIKSVELVGIFNRTKAKAESISNEFSIKKIYDSISDLYLNTKADLVVIAVSEIVIKEVCIEAFNFPWALLVEKPIGLNLKDASFLNALASKNSLKVFIALNRRHYSSTKYAIEELRENSELRVVQVYDQESPSIAYKNGTPKIITENWMYANSIHIVDYFSIFCRGDLLDVNNICKWERDKPSYVLSKLTFSSGDIGIYNAIWEGPSPWVVSINTPSKRLEMKPLEQISIQNYGSRKSTSISIDDWDLKFKPGLRRQAEEIVSALSSCHYNLPTIEDGLITMKMINRIYEI